MKHLILCLVAFIYINGAFAQNSVKFMVKDAENKESLIGATALLTETSNGATTNEAGIAELKNIPNGKQTFEFSYVGYEKQTKTFDFPDDNGKIVDILLSEDEGNLGEIIVSSTRSSRTIAEIPTRIETIAGEELEEKGNMNASNVSMLLRESTGIQTQQTSATSANMNFRIQGLDGRYTQLLQNGLPLYSGFSSGLSIMQIPPLDLKRVEIIKGSSSTLYGGGAIAGMINLISKEPTEERETLLQITGTSAKGADINGFYAQKISEKVGLTLFSSYHFQQPYDPNNDQFSAKSSRKRGWTPGNRSSVNHFPNRSGSATSTWPGTM